MSQAIKRGSSQGLLHPPLLAGVRAHDAPATPGETRPTIVPPSGVLGSVARKVLSPRVRDRLRSTVVNKILGDLSRAGVTIRRIYFQGHGEPLLHPKLAELVRLSRSHYPDAYLSINTNANRVFDEELVRAGSDRWSDEITAAPGSRGRC